MFWRHTQYYMQVEYYIQNLRGFFIFFFIILYNNSEWRIQIQVLYNKEN